MKNNPASYDATMSAGEKLEHRKRIENHIRIISKNLGQNLK
jgi:hypothetical protein